MFMVIYNCKFLGVVVIMRSTKKLLWNFLITSKHVLFFLLLCLMGKLNLIFLRSDYAPVYHEYGRLLEWLAQRTIPGLIISKTSEIGIHSSLLGTQHKEQW